LTTQISNREVYIEIHVVGQFVKVTAMDVESMVEISIQGSKSASEAHLKEAALKRLAYVLKKNGTLA
jgi:hypothetical protein